MPVISTFGEPSRALLGMNQLTRTTLSARASQRPCFLVAGKLNHNLSHWGGGMSTMRMVYVEI